MKDLLRTYRNLDADTRALLPRLPSFVLFLHRHIVHLHGWHFAWTWLVS